MAQQSKSKKVSEKSQVVGDTEIPEQEVSDLKQEELISKVVGNTTTKVMEQLMPYLQQGKQADSKEYEKTVKQVKQRVVRDMNSEYQRVIQDNKNFMYKLSKAPKSDYRTITIPQVYRKYIGPYLPVAINGSFINVPINGRPYRVHKDYYSLIKRRMDYEDDKIATMERTDFSDVIEVDSRDSLGQ